MRLKLSVLSTALMALLLTGCGEDEATQVMTPERMTKGSDLYNYYCRHCHKIRGPGALLENRDPNRPALKNHELMMLMQFGSEERHRNMPTFMDTDPTKLQLIANYVVELQTPVEAEESTTTEPATTQ